MKSLKSLLVTKDKSQLPARFTGEYGSVYIKDERACNSLNAIMDTSFVAVYRQDVEYNKQWTLKGGLSWDTESVYIVTSKWKLISMQNSEWASFTIES